MKHDTLLLTVGLWLVLAKAVLAQAPFDADYYRSPVDHPIKLSGTFGELRQDHFHMGIDVKSARGVAGDKLYAVADGFISRLKVSAAGYGNSLSIDHPNGTRSLYAHLDSYAPAIQAFLDSVHYAEERFEIEVAGESSGLYSTVRGPRFPITKGQYLGTMGNTGSSFGAHLHFELRVATNDAAFNPLLYDFAVTDTRAPELRELGVYRRLPGGATSTLDRFKLTNLGDSASLGELVHVPPGEIGFGLKAYDRQQGTRNLNGVFQIESRCDGAVHWLAKYDTVAYEQTRFIQAHYDYPAKLGGEGYFYRLHRLPGDQLNLYKQHPHEGFIELGFGESRMMSITASDPFGNARTLQFRVVADLPAAADVFPSYHHVLQPDEPVTISLADATLDVPAQAVYTTTYLTTTVSDTMAAGAYSRCYTIGDELEPIHEALSLRVPLVDVPMSLRSKAYLTTCGGDDFRLPAKLTTGSTHLQARVDAWGSYELHVDTNPPVIKPLDRYTYLLEDDITSARDLHYRVTQNGAWVLASFDAKKNRLAVRRDKLGTGKIQVEVWDEAGNRSQVIRG